MIRNKIKKKKGLEIELRRKKLILPSKILNCIKMKKMNQENHQILQTLIKNKIKIFKNFKINYLFKKQILKL
jgi:hypothetical protein